MEEIKIRQPPIPSLSECPLTYLPSFSRKNTPSSLYGRGESDEASSVNTVIMKVTHMVQGLVGDLRGAAAKKQVVKSGTASQRRGGEVCLQTGRLARPRAPSLSL